MRRELPSLRGTLKPLADRLDRAAEAINPLLLMLAIVLAVLDAGCYMALAIGELHLSRPGMSVETPSAPLSRAAVSGLPPS